VHSGVHLHAVHEKRTVPGDHHDAPARRLDLGTAERHPDTGTKAVAHASHAECDREPAPAPHRQVMDGRRAGIAGINDNVDPVG